MEALVLALGLRMIRPAVGDPHAEIEQPDGQARVTGLAAGGAPRRAVVGQDAPRQPIALEHPLQARLHRQGLLVGAGAEFQCVAGVVVQHRQRMATSAPEREVTFEVHLPQIVRRGVLEAPDRARRAALSSLQQPAATQDLGDRRGRRRRSTLRLEHAANLAPAPGRMRLADRHNPRFHLVGRAARASQRSTRAVLQPQPTFGVIPSEPQICCRRADPVAPAELANVRPASPRQPAELLPVRHDRTLPEWHGRPSSFCQRCSPCLRTPVQLVSGLYTLTVGHDDWGGNLPSLPALSSPFPARGWRRPSPCRPRG